MLGAVDRGYAFDLLEALAAGDGAALMEQADHLESRSLSFDAVLQELAALLHGMAVFQLAPAAADADDPDFKRTQALASRFAQDEVQLCYQIAVQGRTDLSLAPDEYAGFTMTLLRMLAFTPGEAGAEEPLKARQPVSAQPGNPKPQSAPSHKEQNPAADSSAAISAIGDWREFVKSLGMGGMAGMLAGHCELTSFQDGRMELSVPEAHRHLMDKSYQDKLRSVLQQRLGSALRAVEIKLGGNGDTPAERDARDERARQARAIEAIESDPFVRELVEDLGGRIVTDSIRPLP